VRVSIYDKVHSVPEATPCLMVKVGILAKGPWWLVALTNCSFVTAYFRAKKRRRLLNELWPG
jgi:hypothetical protein